MTVRLKRPTYRNLPVDAEGVLLRKDADAPMKRVRRTGAKVFDTSSPASLEEYAGVMDRVHAGTASLVDRALQYNPAKEGWLIYLEWADKSYKPGD